MPAQDITLYTFWSGGSGFFSEFEYSSNNGITIVGYTGVSTIVKIPSKIGDVAVTTIAEDAFADKTALLSIIVPDSVTSIGQGAFNGCNSLISITLPFIGTSRTSTGRFGVFGAIFGFEEKVGGHPYNYYSSSTSSPSIAGGYTSSGIIDYYGNDTYSGTGVWQYSEWDSTGEYFYWTKPDPHDEWRFYKHAFYYFIPSTIKSVRITDGNNISTAAFQNCKMIEKITLNSSSKSSIGTDAFSKCNAVVSYC